MKYMSKFIHPIFVSDRIVDKSFYGDSYSRIQGEKILEQPYGDSTLANPEKDIFIWCSIFPIIF